MRQCSKRSARVRASFSRKRAARTAVRYCLQEGGIELAQVDYVVFYDKPFLKFERLLETYLAFAPRGFRSFRMALPIWIKEKLFQKRLLRQELERFAPDYDWEKRLLFCEHHQSHAASAYFASPFEEAAVLTMDGVGEWATTSLGIGRGNTLQMIKEIHFPHSLGLLYSAFTYYTGFKVNSGEYKVMGLALYGQPRFAQTILDHLIDLKPDGSFHLDQGYFDYCTGLRMTNDRFDNLFGGPARHPEEPLTQRDMDLAASVQAVAEEVVSHLARSIADETGARNLCLARGSAQLRSQRQSPTRRVLRADLGTAGFGRCRRGARGGIGRLSPVQKGAASAGQHARRDAGELSRPGFFASGNRATLE
jgi:carbamoyltransferase